MSIDGLAKGRGDIVGMEKGIKMERKDGNATGWEQDAVQGRKKTEVHLGRDRRRRLEDSDT